MARKKKLKGWLWIVGGALAYALWPRAASAATMPGHVTPDHATPPSDVVYVVVRGDTLSKIAARYGTTWQALFEANRDQIANPDLIYPGQQLIIP